MEEGYAGLGAGLQGVTTLPEMYQQATAKLEAPSLAETLGAAVEQEFFGVNMLRTIDREQEAAEFMADPGWTPDTSLVAEMNLSDRELDYLKKSSNQTAFDNRVAHIEEDRARSEIIAKAGVIGTGAVLAAAILDPTTAPLILASGGAAGVAKVGRLQGAVRGALAAGGINAATEYLMMQGDTQRDWEDVMLAGVGGFVLGGALGAITAKSAGRATGYLDDLKRANDMIDDMRPSVPIAGLLEGPRPAGLLPAPDKSNLPVLYDARAALETLSSGAIRADTPYGARALLEYKGSLQNRVLLEETNALNNWTRKAAAEAELAKVQEDLARITNNPYVMDDLQYISKMQAETKELLDAASNLPSRSVLKGKLDRAIMEGARLSSELKAARAEKAKGSGRKLVLSRQAIKDRVGRLEQEIQANDARVSRYTGSLATLAKSKRAAGDLETLARGEIPAGLRSRYEQLKSDGQSAIDTELSLRLMKEEKAYKLSKEIEELEAKLDNYLQPPTPKGRSVAREKIIVDKTAYADKTAKEFAKETPFKVEPEVQIEPPDADLAPLSNTVRHTRLPAINKLIREYSATPIAWGGKLARSVASRLSNSDFGSIRGLNAMLNSLPQGGLPGRTNASAIFDNLHRVSLKNIAPAQMAAQEMFRRKGYNLVTQQTQRAQAKLAEFNNQVVLYIKGVEPRGPDADLIKQAGESYRKTFHDSLDWRKRSGVRGFEHIDESEGYFSMLPQGDKIRAMTRVHGEEAVLNVFTEAYLRGTRLSKIADKDVARKVAESIARAQYERAMVSELNTANAVSKVLDAKTRTFISKEMERIGIKQEDMESWFKAMEAAEDKLTMSSRAKASFGADMTTEVNGLRLVDLIDTDMDVALRYSREAAADTALAKMGFKSKADVTDAMDDAQKRITGQLEAMATKGELTAKQLADKRAALGEEITLLQHTLKQLYGKSLEADEFGKLPAWVEKSRIARSIASTICLNWNGLASVPELGNIIAAQGLGTVLKHLPKFKIRPSKFKENDPILDQWQGVTGAYGHLEGWFYGSRKGTDVMQEMGVQVGNLEKGVRTIGEAQQLLSGFKHIQHGYEEINLRSMIYNMEKAAMRGEVSPKMYKQFAETGMSPDDLDAVMTFLKGNRTTVTRNGKKYEIADLDKMNPELRDKLGASMTTQLHRAIQRQMIGETPEIMNREFGRLMFQFMSFTIGAVEKQLIRGIRSDRALLVSQSIWQSGLAYGAHMAYTFGMAAQAADPDAYLEKALEPDNLAYGVLMRTGQLGALQVAFDSLATVGAIPDSMMASPGAAGAQSMVKAPPVISTAVRAASLPFEYAGHAYDALSGDLDDEALARTNRKALRTIPVVNTAAVGFAYAALNSAMGD